MPLIRYIQFVEIADKDPWFVEGLRYTGEQIKVLFLSFLFQITLETLLLQGACLVPKRALNVMTGEVNRVLQLANTSIIPITWQVPRKRNDNDNKGSFHLRFCGIRPLRGFPPPS